jgi:hypothetical protein
VTPTKKKLLYDFQKQDLHLERERTAYKKEKLEREMQEKDMEIEERREFREHEAFLRGSNRKQLADLMSFVRSTLEYRKTDSDIKNAKVTFENI